MKRLLTTGLLIFTVLWMQAAYLLIPMDSKQKEHLKAYGMAYWVLENAGLKVDWLLNYRGGSFAFPHNSMLELECNAKGVTYEIIPNAQYNAIMAEIADPEKNMDAVKLEKPPKIAVYSPKEKQPWDDAVTMVLTYAEIPYDVVYDDEVMEGELPKYDWLHLHHEDFTGQYGKFWYRYKNADWYKATVAEQENIAARYGLTKVSQLKLAVVHKFREFVLGGGFLFAMCSATDTYDIALAAEGVDICDYMFDGDPPEPNAQSRLDYSKTFAFKDFSLRMDPREYEYSNIDANFGRRVLKNMDYFTLFDFSAKWDPIPTMLTQCHTRTVMGFMGQTTAFKKQFIKSDVLIMGENKAANEARYIHGEFGEGFWSFYGGHDPADYQHFVNDPKTDLSYTLIPRGID